MYSFLKFVYQVHHAHRSHRNAQGNNTFVNGQVLVAQDVATAGPAFLLQYDTDTPVIGIEISRIHQRNTKVTFINPDSRPVRRSVDPALVV